MSAKLIVGLLLPLAIVACKPAPFNGVDITDATYAANFRLTDHTGQTRSLSDFRGKAVAVFFGFAQCPDVCPTTLTDLAQVRKRLGSDADRLQVVFITLDPERDTPTVLAQYVPAFDPSFVGLTGAPETIAQTAKGFRVFYMKQPGVTPTSYTIDHTAGTYLFDREGKVRLFLRHGQGVDQILSDVKRLL